MLSWWVIIPILLGFSFFTLGFGFIIACPIWIAVPIISSLFVVSRQKKTVRTVIDLVEVLEKGSKPNFYVESCYLKCVACSNLTPLQKCNNCGWHVYAPGVSENRVVGIFCTKCERGFTGWTCQCGAKNPIKTIIWEHEESEFDNFMQDAIRPVVSETWNGVKDHFNK